jgi:hypothetical protein
LKQGAEEGFWSKEVAVTGGWRNLDNEDLRNLYPSPNTNTVIRRMRWAGHVACMGEKRMHSYVP